MESLGVFYIIELHLFFNYYLNNSSGKEQFLLVCVG